MSVPSHIVDMARQMVAGTWPNTQNNVDMLEYFIEKEQMRASYVDALGIVLWGKWEIDRKVDDIRIWELLRTTPAQRAQAFLNATQ